MRIDRLAARRAGPVLVLLLAACTATGPGVRTDNPDSERQEAARVNTDLGLQYLHQGQLQLSLEKLERALVHDPSYVDAHTVLAALYEQIGDSKKAEQHYRRAAQLRPKGGAELNNYGTFLCKLGRHAEAQQWFQRALQDPFYRTPAIALANSGTCLLQAGRRDEAEAALRQALELQPGNAEALSQLASVLYEKGEYFNARAFIQRYESTAPVMPSTLLLARNIELKLGNASQAAEYTQRLLREFPDSTEAKALAARN